MKRIIAPLLYWPISVFADRYGVDEAMSEGASGGGSWWHLVAAAVAFYAFVRVMALFKDDATALKWLVIFVVGVLFASGVKNCTSG